MVMALVFSVGRTLTERHHQHFQPSYLEAAVKLQDVRGTKTPMLRNQEAQGSDLQRRLDI